MSRIFEITVPSLIGIVSIGCLFWYKLKRSDDPSGILFKVVLSLVVIICEIFLVRATAGDSSGAYLAAGSLAVFGLILSIIWTPLISGFLVSFLDGGNIPPVSRLYSAAIVKRKSNQPLEAIADVREQLAKSPDDFEGVMLLANIQAEDLKDLPSAEKTLNHFCEWGQASREQVVAAFTQLADWHLKFYRSAAPAKAALQHIVDKYPGTDAARAAQERIAHLEVTGKKPTLAP